MQTKVYLLDSGTIRMNESELFWLAGLQRPYRAPVYGVLIEHAEGRFLFDTGQDKDVFTRLLADRAATSGAAGDPNSLIPIEQTADQTLGAQLALVGLSPRDINFVMNSHYHLDHCGGNHLCTCATTICHRDEYAAAINPHPIEKLGYSDLRFLQDIPADAARGIAAYTPKLEFVSGDVEVAKGVTLFETPGHTPGHYSLLVRLANRKPMIFTGDACYAQKSIDLMAISTAHVDPKQAYASLDRLKQLSQDHDADLFFAHDHDMWQTYIKAPGYYI